MASATVAVPDAPIVEPKASAPAPISTPISAPPASVEAPISAPPAPIVEPKLSPFEIAVNDVVNVVHPPHTYWIEHQFPHIGLEFRVSTISASLTLVMNVKDIGSKFVAKYPVVSIGSNFGENVLPGWEKFVCKRKRRIVGSSESKRRKPVGSGKKMNSCAEFCIVDTTKHLTMPDVATVKFVKVYKIKLFNTGPLQISGHTSPIMDNIPAIIKNLTEYLTPYFTSPVVMTTKNPLHFTMINYCAQVCNEYQVELEKLTSKLWEFKRKQLCVSEIPQDVLPVPHDEHKYHQLMITDVKFGHDSYIVIDFSVNIPNRKPRLNKTISVKVTYKSKINIRGGMGGIYEKFTIDIYKFLLSMLHDPDIYFTPLPVHVALSKRKKQVARQAKH